MNSPKLGNSDELTPAQFYEKVGAILETDAMAHDDRIDGRIDYREYGIPNDVAIYKPAKAAIEFSAIRNALIIAVPDHHPEVQRAPRAVIDNPNVVIVYVVDVNGERDVPPDVMHLNLKKTKIEPVRVRNQDKGKIPTDRYQPRVINKKSNDGDKVEKKKKVAFVPDCFFSEICEGVRKRAEEACKVCSIDCKANDVDGALEPGATAKEATWLYFDMDEAAQLREFLDGVEIHRNRLITAMFLTLMQAERPLSVQEIADRTNHTHGSITNYIRKSNSSFKRRISEAGYELVVDEGGKSRKYSLVKAD